MTSAEPGSTRGWALAAHAAVLAAVLVLAALWIGAHGQISVDEGVAVVQARQLDEHGTWSMDHPLEGVDPDGSAFPLRHASRTDDGGYVPFAKHPLYPVLLAGASAGAGVAGMVGLSIAGVVGASVAAALLARRLDPRLAVPALYVTGGASPLLFDASLVIAHAPGAAAAGVAALSLVRHHESGARTSPWLALAAAGLALTVLLRGEGPLLLGALVVVAVAAAARTRSAAWTAIAATAACAGVVAFVVERLWVAAIFGDAVDLPNPPAEASSWLADRLEGLTTTLVRPGYGGDDRATVLLVVGVATLAAAVLALRRGGLGRAPGALAAAGAGVTMMWALTAPSSPVPGLLAAFPLLWFGLAAGRWWDRGLAVALAATSGVFALAVVATQYRQAGGFEWGARYLAIALPLVVPVALLGLLRGLEALDRRTARPLVGSLVVVCVALSVTAVAVERRLTRATERFGERVAAVAPPSRLGAGDQDGRPVVVSAEFAVPQLVWPELEERRWLRLRDDEPIEVRGVAPEIDALYRAGIDRFTFLTRDLDRDRPLLGGGREVERHRIAGWDAVVVAPPVADANMRSMSLGGR